MVNPLICHCEQSVAIPCFLDLATVPVTRRVAQINSTIRNAFRLGKIHPIH